MSSQPATILVQLPLPVGSGYDYLAPEGVDLQIGTLVEVPFGKKLLIGAVWGHGSGLVPTDKLRPIAQILPFPPLPLATVKFVNWVANYTVTPVGAVFKMMMGANWRLPTAKDIFTAQNPNPSFFQPELTAQQQDAAAQLVRNVEAEQFSATLLDGVTGSGKTETYCEAIAATLRQGKQTLLLLPEIAMTAALIARLETRFGVKPVEWHSGLSEKQRRINWHSIAQDKAQFILGARSALFLPYPSLGLIVVDEEHEAAYKQEEGVIYHGRDMAVVRAQLGKIPIVLASATPSLETLHNVKQKKYQHVVLPERYGKANMPTIKLVDLRQEKLLVQNFISAPLLEALQQTMEKKQQAMLFLNRRGYAPLTLCRGCGHRLQCPNCSSWLIEHKSSGRLHCHHCSYRTQRPNACPMCKAEGKFAACGPGIERIAEEVKARLPEIRFAIMASDTLSGADAALQLVQQMQDQSLDLLIGTQIMAKGYHFPRLTLVGVIDADLGLSGGDPRAAERTFQLLQQVSGRSGRAEDSGQVFLQTTAPEHPVMQALCLGSRDGFMATELRERQKYDLPPFARLASVTLSGADQREVISEMQQLAAQVPRHPKIRMLGPAPTPFALLRGRYRQRLLMLSPRGFNLSGFIQQWISTVKVPRQFRLQIDIDPYSFL